MILPLSSACQPLLDHIELTHSGSASGVVADPPSPTPTSSMAAGGLKPSSALKPSQRSG